ncbi:short-chain dehydrogenase/reductase [Novosphingobium endophyticum]|uniref:Short-chain dehydrogenase/reductase n=1 Tax=Novosphingobium endophyticum TaxID=1955250 RepID=A0A916TSN0_9SPHN|nr:SDR family NAD(P)-dependent oxidoreductase [Novosphingobium endophyticum]GGC02904.1 short-chain dehydrogenase/reductase [Novosphingobium endophyticum]
MTGERRWFITGISSGIGQALAHAALAAGDSVIGTARDDNTIARFEESSPGRAIGIRLDVSRLADIAGAVDRALTHGPVDILVNNAGQSLFGAFEEVPVEEARALFDVNVFGPWALARAMLPHFRARGAGQFVHVSSGCGLNGTPGLSAYCASKFALEGFSETLALEIAGFGLRVMIVEPGAVATRFISHGTREAGSPIEAYAALSGSGKAMLEGYYATAASTPESVADAIMAALAAPEPPLRLLVGDDGRPAVLQKADHLRMIAGG